MSEPLNITDYWSLFHETQKWEPRRTKYQTVASRCHRPLSHVLSERLLCRVAQSPTGRRHFELKQGTQDEILPRRVNREGDVPGEQGPKSRRTARCRAGRLWETAQACKMATAQDGLLMAHGSTASAQVWQRNRCLVRSVLAMVYSAMSPL